PFVNNHIDPAWYSKPALYVISAKTDKPFPTTNNPCGEITYSGNRSAPNEGNYVGKVDYQKSAMHSLFGRLLIQTYNEPNPEAFNTSALQNTGWRNSKEESYTLGSTYLFNPDTVHAFRLAVNRTGNYYHNTEKGDLFTWCDAGVQVYCAPEITRISNLVINGA